MTGRLDQLGAGVLAWIDDDPGPGRPNAGVIVDDDGLTLVDTLMVASQWEPFAQAVEALERPVRRAVLTSSHIEYVGGTNRFWQAGFYGTAQASAHLDQPPAPDVYRRRFPDHTDEFPDDFVTRAVTHVVTAPAWLTPAVLVAPLPGQTAENLVVHVPGADVVFAGALASFGVTPDAFQSDPGAWIASLDTIAALAPTIIPGHGRPGGADECAMQQAYLRACVEAAASGQPLASGPWEDWPGAERHEVNIERAAIVARGDDEVPPTLLAELEEP